MLSPLITSDCLLIEFDDLLIASLRYNGNEKLATVKRRVVCRNCKGKAHLPRCAECGACPKEKKMVHRRAGPGMVVQQEVRPPLRAFDDPSRVPLSASACLCVPLLPFMAGLVVELKEK